ncbi:uncharacterized protein KY384_007020 [Bacidia gigantensis]|uniref:uncharacterized protein n=1 Tax=Bacidia gigantensis TaxID=2732470 RepID=UPI001D04263C|nr:uncharacterized protein KY384_007020 [Bacidia gigantensis]KAG8528104.1 hypothetical protein KY384_007020 [Bacidia gigantensis]
MSSALSKSNVDAAGRSLSIAPSGRNRGYTPSPAGKPRAKQSENDHYLDVPLQNAFARTSDTFFENSLIATDSASENGFRAFLSGPEGMPAKVSRHHKIASYLKHSWVRNKGLALVAISQLFGVMMNVTIRLLEQNSVHGPGMHPFQILFVRMMGTLILSGIYLYWAQVADAPFGARGVRVLLIARGVGGFFGVYGMYYSLQYLPLSDATVITFLAPIVACWACSVLLKEPFTRTEQIAGVMSLIGVIVIARPGTSQANPMSSGSVSDSGIVSMNATTSVIDPKIQEATPKQRAGAVGAALIGVLGAACAYTTIRWIGKRAHPLISVNYFAAWCTIVSSVALLAVPGVDFRLPAGWVQWAYLVFLAICGFVMQFLLTAGLSYEKGSRATNMVYTQMLFAIAFDKIVFDATPDLLSILGSSMILGSSLYVAVLQNSAVESKKTVDAASDEELGLIQEESTETRESSLDERGPLRGIQEVQAL